MHLITQALSERPDGLEIVPVPVDRHKLARRRWRGSAVDGTDFGFDVTEALNHQDCIFISNGRAYCIEQVAEPCFILGLGSPQSAAWLGWMIGNLHFKAAFSSQGILVQDDLAVQQMLEREYIHYHRVLQVFQPSQQGGHSHAHAVVVDQASD